MRYLRGKPLLNYPCRWKYTVIGADARELSHAVARAVGDTPYSLVHSRSSRSGRYVALSLSLTVQDEAQRVGVYEALRQEKCVEIVL